MQESAAFEKKHHGERETDRRNHRYSGRNCRCGRGSSFRSALLVPAREAGGREYASRSSVGPAVPSLTRERLARERLAPGRAPDPRLRAPCRPTWRPSRAPAQETAAAPADAPLAPSFDVVRVEPDGESVIAGRSAPGATIELLRGDQVHARGVADASGLFAIIPPPLPSGSHQIVLQSIAPDGARQRSRESVTVVINPDKTRPLVALASPDKPTVLLSNPEMPEAKPAQDPKAETKTAEAKPAAPGAAEPLKPAQQAGAPAQSGPQQQASAASRASGSSGPARPTPADQDRDRRRGGGEALRVGPLGAGSHDPPLSQREPHRSRRGRGRRQGVLRHRQRRQARRLPGPPRRRGSGVGPGEIAGRGGLQRSRS
jgi:hypothetical protein